MSKESKTAKRARLERIGKDHRWKKGQPSPNPAGRPKAASSLVKELRAVITERDPKSEQGLSYMQTIARKMCYLAAQGSIRAFGEIRDTLEGKPQQSIALSGSLATAAREERLAEALDRLDALREVKHAGRVN